VNLNESALLQYSDPLLLYVILYHIVGYGIYVNTKFTLKKSKN